ncbi:hypothetical protein GMORB2_2910 [Geosmithia morbida]|uniref:Uncharacterized protein n=1 Tax=Geosmithia morbida TaxID=1094350 RepID=A0A9P4YRG3_9HYPO|nr:uncharacterized protein GMORB2_2910 [Geosmithia morbida]KAF4120472.1 hypothetical protein GMORB2_2910 [Geosmithia morbida]
MSSPSTLPYPPPPPPPPSGSRTAQSVSRQHRRSTSDTSLTPTRPTSVPRSTNFPFSFIRPFQPNLSSTSLVPSTAEGKPIPVDDSTVENRTSALRELNNNYPSRHRYERSTGAENTTYSEPVIVHSYYSPLPSRPISTTHGGVLVTGGAGTVSQSGSSATAERRLLPFSATVTTARNGMLSRMSRRRDKRFSAAESGGVKLPPVEAFTFKSFLDNMETQEDGGSSINADLDRIAEICAKSRYSLSNQYEVHYTPHGSGSSFLGVNRGGGQDPAGPTLQAVSSDDERSMKHQRRQQQRRGVRRNSRAMGTLETIMSSSRSSDEEGSKKRSAADLADEVRGRATTKGSGSTSPARSSKSTAADNQQQDDGNDGASVHSHPLRRRSTSLALIDNTKQGSSSQQQQQQQGGSTSGKPPRNSGTTMLVGQPVQPQASTSHLEIRTTPPKKRTKETQGDDGQQDGAPTLPTNRQTLVIRSSGTFPLAEAATPRDGLLTALTGWIPWTTASSDTPVNASPGRAEGSLRELLRTSDRSKSDVGGALL